MDVAKQKETGGDGGRGGWGGGAGLAGRVGPGRADGGCRRGTCRCPGNIGRARISKLPQLVCHGSHGLDIVSNSKPN